MGIPCAGQVNDIFELKERVNAFELKMLANLGLVEPIGSMINKGNEKKIISFFFQFQFARMLMGKPIGAFV